MCTDWPALHSYSRRFLSASLLIRARILVAVGCVSLVACSTGDGTPPISASVEVTPANTSFAFLGETVQLTATAKDASGNTIQGKTFSWSSSDANIATVSSTGLASSVANGSATITATTDGVAGTAVIVVGQVATQLQFTVQPTNTEIGSVIPIEVTIQDAAGNAVVDAQDDVTMAINDNPGGGTLTGTTVISAVAAVANFYDLAIDRAGAGYTLVATSGTLTSVTSATFDVTNPMPGITAIFPPSVTAGGPGGAGLTLTVDGSNFVPDSVVLFNGVGRASTLISDTELETLLPTSDIADGGSAAIAVLNPEPGGGISNELLLAIVNPVPNVASISPSAAAVGASGFDLVVNGSAFVPSSVVRWDGTDLPTTFEQSNRLTATVSGAELGLLGTAQVTVFNPQPSGGVSEGISFTIYRSVPIATNDIIYNPVDGMIYASTPSAAGAIGNSISSIDPNTGDIGFSVFVGSEPNTLAVSDDGSTLYVGLDGSAQVRRFDIASQTAGIQFGLGDGGSGRFRYPQDIEVLPGSVDAVAVSLWFSSGSPRYAGVAIFDDGVARPTEVPGFSGTGSHIGLIEFSAVVERLYGGSVEANPTRFTRMDVDANGVSIVDTTEDLIPGAFGNREIVFDAGLIYTTQGGLIDPEGRTLVATFQLPSSGSLPFLRPDSSAMQVHYITTDRSNGAPAITTFDDTTFIRLWTLALDGISGTPSRLLRWGVDGLAFRTENEVVILRHPLVGRI